MGRGIRKIAYDLGLDIKSARSMLDYQMLDWIDENKRLLYFPENGPHRRELYKKHMEFFEAGQKYAERCFMAANRVGKTESAGAFEVSYHLTGGYPDWWPGKRFDHPVKCWVSGEKRTTTRDIQQRKLFGPPDAIGHGMVPRSAIADLSTMPGVKDAFEHVAVYHHDETGQRDGISFCHFKCYQEGRKGFEGDEVDVGWMDELPPDDVYSEMLVRTLTTHGIVILTVTPMGGLTQLIRSFHVSG